MRTVHEKDLFEILSREDRLFQAPSIVQRRVAFFASKDIYQPDTKIDCMPKIDVVEFKQALLRLAIKSYPTPERPSKKCPVTSIPQKLVTSQDSLLQCPSKPYFTIFSFLAEFQIAFLQEVLVVR